MSDSPHTPQIPPQAEPPADKSLVKIVSAIAALLAAIAALFKLGPKIAVPVIWLTALVSVRVFGTVTDPKTKKLTPLGLLFIFLIVLGVLALWIVLTWQPDYPQPR